MKYEMYRATTPIHSFTLPENADSYDEIQIAYKQTAVKKPAVNLVKHYQDNTLPSGMTFDGKTVIITLTQEETKLFSKGNLIVHLRVLTTDSHVWATKKWTISVEESNNEDILE